jgi:diaminopimelate epimerase
MEISFYKYQGTGNDFVMIDDRNNIFPDQRLEIVQLLCHRKFGIGSDGLILIRNKAGYDFEMIYFNADGSQSMCGNGARCAVAFASFLEIIQEKASFYAIDGPHIAKLSEGLVYLGMKDVGEILEQETDFFVNTGSPHHVRFVEDVWQYPVFKEGAAVRYSSAYQPNGTNVNFVTPKGRDLIQVRTYERGVEDETLSCGTGVTACALVYGSRIGLEKVNIETPGGMLCVSFKANGSGIFSEVTLIGPARQVFEGKITIS